MMVSCGALWMQTIPPTTRNTVSYAHPSYDVMLMKFYLKLDWKTSHANIWHISEMMQQICSSFKAVLNKWSQAIASQQNIYNIYLFSWHYFSVMLPCNVSIVCWFPVIFQSPLLLALCHHDSQWPSHSLAKFLHNIGPSTMYFYCHYELAKILTLTNVC